MRILLCTKNDVFGADILNWLLPRLARHELTVLLGDNVPAKAGGIPDLVVQKTLEYEVPLNRLFPLIDAQPLHGELLTFQGLAQRHGVSIEKVYNINDSASERRIRDFAPDVNVLARFNLILKANTLLIPRLGTYNIHPGALPGYAGLLAPMRGLLNGDARLGCTLHQVDEGIDTGNIYSVSWLPAVPSRSVFGHIADLYRMGLVSLMSLLEELDQGVSPTLTPQDRTAFRYYRLPVAGDFAELRRRGVELALYPDYCRFIRRFWPDGMQGRTPEFFEPAGIEAMIAQITADGSPGSP